MEITIRTFSKMKYEQISNAVLLTFTNPSNLNALCTEVLMQLSDVLSEIEALALADRSLRCLILTGEGKAFIAGADIAEMKELGPAAAREFSSLGNEVMMKLENLRLPTIAAVNGFALGGGLELALACDFIYLSENSKLGLPEATLGLIPGFGGTRRLALRTGIPAAKELLYTGRMIDAADALRLGIANRICGADGLIREAVAVSEEMAKTSPHAVISAKELLNISSDIDVETMKAVETGRFGLIFSHPDAAEGMEAFLEKRKAGWMKN